MSTAIEDAKRILRGEAAVAEKLFTLGKLLNGEQKFDLARRIFARAAEQETNDAALRRKIVQQHASCTEKDPDLPLDRRFAEAHAIIKPVLKEAEERLPRETSPALAARSVGSKEVLR